jgi:hypothetical protein
MPINERHIAAVGPIAELLVTQEDVDARQRVFRAIDPDGTVDPGVQPWFRLRSPDGSVWRVKVTNAGALTTTKET